MIPAQLRNVSLGRLHAAINLNSQVFSMNAATDEQGGDASSRCTRYVMLLQLQVYVRIVKFAKA